MAARCLSLDGGGSGARGGPGVARIATAMANGPRKNSARKKNPTPLRFLSSATAAATTGAGEKLHTHGEDENACVHD